MKKRIAEKINEMQGGYTPYEIFTDWVELMALSICNTCHLVHDKVWQQREEQYLKIISKYNKEERYALSEMFNMLVCMLEDNTTDALGEIYMEAGCGNKGTGQFFTPFNLSRMLAGFNLPKEIDGKFYVNEPSCGAGGMIIAMCQEFKKRGIDYQHKVKVVAQDLDWNAVYMTYVQISLLGVDGIVCQGDTLGEPDIYKYPKYRIFETPARLGLLL